MRIPCEPSCVYPPSMPRLGRLKKLATTADVQRFLETQEQLSGYHTPLAYAMQSDVYAFCAADGQINGGFMLKAKPPYRFEDFIPAEELPDVTARLDLSDVVELSSGFLRPKFRGRASSVRYWLMLFAGAIRARKKTIVGSVTVAKLNAYYLSTCPTLLHESTTMIDGEPSPLWFYSYTRKQALIGLLYGCLSNTWNKG
jgi:hypothetical protein